jgi:hypothetical protein
MRKTGDRLLLCALLSHPLIVQVNDRDVRRCLCGQAEMTNTRWFRIRKGSNGRPT